MPAVRGAEIRDRRRRLGLKTPELAAQLRISRSHLANLELGHKEASIEVVYRLASALGTEAEDLLVVTSDAA